MKSKLLIVFSVITIMIYIIISYFIFRDPPLLVSLEKKIKESKELTISLCDVELEGNSTEILIKDFFNRFQSKKSGSHPIEFYKFKIFLDKNKEFLFFLGEDSRNNSRNESLFWLYSYGSSRVGSPLAYIKSDILKFEVKRCKQGQNHQ